MSVSLSFLVKGTALASNEPFQSQFLILDIKVTTWERFMHWEGSYFKWNEALQFIHDTLLETDGKLIALKIYPTETEGSGGFFQTSPRTFIDEKTFALKFNTEQGKQSFIGLVNQDSLREKYYMTAEFNTGEACSPHEQVLDVLGQALYPVMSYSYVVDRAQFRISYKVKKSNSHFYIIPASYNQFSLFLELNPHLANIQEFDIGYSWKYLENNYPQEYQRLISRDENQTSLDWEISYQAYFYAFGDIFQFEEFKEKHLDNLLRRGSDPWFIVPGIGSVGGGTSSFGGMAALYYN